MKIGICDDEPICIQQLEHIIIENFNDVDIVTYSCGQKMKEALRDNAFDILFLDIMMEDMNGAEVAEYLRNDLQNYKTSIVWVSSVKEKDVRLFNVNPFAFVEKPVVQEQIIEVMNKYRKIQNLNSETFTFDALANKGNPRLKVSVAYSDIIYLESKKRKISITTYKGSFEFYGKLSDYRDMFYAHDFVSPHYSFLINRKEIFMVKRDSVIMNGELEVPISKQGKKEMLGF